MNWVVLTHSEGDIPDNMHQLDQCWANEGAFVGPMLTATVGLL